MPTPAVGSLLLPQIGTWTPSLTAMVRWPSQGSCSEARPRKKLGQVLPWCRFCLYQLFHSGAWSSGRALLWVVSERLGPITKLAGAESPPPLRASRVDGIHPMGAFPIVHVLVTPGGRRPMLLCPSDRRAPLPGASLAQTNRKDES